MTSALVSSNKLRYCYYQNKHIEVLIRDWMISSFNAIFHTTICFRMYLICSILAILELHMCEVKFDQNIQSSSCLHLLLDTEWVMENEVHL